ncbi:cation transporter [Vibrio sp. S4M6]|uniref:heavy-metal-associated domain-containing protein n=1 Tax=Vibrio sinus TaxID=2946865 RepID=UPI002029C57D|nr:cation transporter [Vibrio sinus]MCL9781975.1 cation transporter [Vibrio sinus]
MNVRNESKQVFDLGKVSCGGCVKSIEEALNNLPEVDFVEVDFDKKQASVAGNVEAAVVINAVEQAGYEAHLASN